jgi:hypothetical protein
MSKALSSGSGLKLAQFFILGGWLDYKNKPCLAKKQ